MDEWADGQMDELTVENNSAKQTSDGSANLVEIFFDFFWISDGVDGDQPQRILRSDVGLVNDLLYLRPRVVLEREDLNLQGLLTLFNGYFKLRYQFLSWSGRWSMQSDVERGGGVLLSLKLNYDHSIYQA